MAVGWWDEAAAFGGLREFFGEFDGTSGLTENGECTNVDGRSGSGGPGTRGWSTGLGMRGQERGRSLRRERER